MKTFTKTFVLAVIGILALFFVPVQAHAQSDIPTTPSPWRISTEFAKGEAPVGKINFYPAKPFELPDNFGVGSYSFGMGSETDTGTPIYAFDMKWGGHWLLSKKAAMYVDAGLGISLFYRQNGPLSLDNVAGRGVLYFQVGF